jgi:competence ComEA-like helix-hairpin-helix protein
MMLKKSDCLSWKYFFLLFAFMMSIAVITGAGVNPAQAAKHAPDAKIDINKADQATLEKLPGIGPGKAKAIIDGRPYKTIEDVMRVSDIKKQTFDAIKDYIVVR